MKRLGKKSSRTRQYTIRNVPAEVDHALRKKAKANGKSLNETALEALCNAAGVDSRARLSEFRDIIGSWVEDPEFDRLLEAQRQIDEELWR